MLLCQAPALHGQPLPVTAAAGAHALTVPWYPGAVNDRFNPAFLVGAERTLRQGEHWRLYQTGNLGFFLHYWWMTGVSLDTGLGVGRGLPLGLQADFRLGVGYLHYFFRRRELELRDGEWVETSGLGRPSLLVPASLLIAYSGPPARPLAVAPFFAVRWGFQALFLEEMPVMSHLQLLVGVRIQRHGLWSGER
ncbi:MAG: hypothetical protein P8Z36_08400 [Gemmatimonadota bacterium]